MTLFCTVTNEMTPILDFVHSVILSVMFAQILEQILSDSKGNYFYRY